MPILCPDDVITPLTISGLALTAAQIAFITNKLIPNAEGKVKRYLQYDPSYQFWTEYYPEDTPRNIESDLLVSGYELRESNRIYPYGLGDYSRSCLYLRNIPLRNLVSVFENPSATDSFPVSFPPDTQLSPADFYVDQRDNSGVNWTALLRRQLGTWTTRPRCVMVNYWSGIQPQEWDALWPEFKPAVASTVIQDYLVAIARSRSITMGQLPASITIKDFSVTFVSNPRIWNMSTSLTQETIDVLETRVRWSQLLGL